MRRVADDPRHEVALHAELMWTASSREPELIAQALGRRPRGCSAHGGPHCVRFQGAPNVLWAALNGFDYTELLQHTHHFPHRFVMLDEDGAPRALEILCLPHHESFDTADGPGRDQIERRLPGWLERRGLLQLMNHPDINGLDFSALLGSLPREGRLDWTAAQAADWWRRSHTRTHLSVRSDRTGHVTVRSEAGVRDLVLEVRDPGGTVRRQVVSLEPGETCRLAAFAGIAA